jgi:hypothetical protein
MRQSPQKIDFSGLRVGERFLSTVHRTTRQAEGRKEAEMDYGQVLTRFGIPATIG